MKKKIFINVDNTLSVPFFTGIQRTAFEITAGLLSLNDPKWEFIPVRYCSICKTWLRISSDSFFLSIKSKFESNNIEKTGYNSVLRKDRWLRIGKKFYQAIGHKISKYPHGDLQVVSIDEDSVFVDIDSAWHSGQSKQYVLSKNTIVFLHDLIPLIFPNYTYPGVDILFERYLTFHIRRDSLFICNSEETKRSLKEYIKKSGLPKNLRIEVIRLGEKEFRGFDALEKKAFSSKSYGKYILYVATIEPRKNHTLLLDACDVLFEKYSDINLVLVGKRGWNMEKVTRRIEGHPQFNCRIFWINGLSEESLYDLYDNAYLCVFTSFYEGFGLPIVEGLSRGCVTLSSHAGALPEAGGEFVEYFDPNDLNDLCKKIEKYLTDDQIYCIQRKIVLERVSVPWSETVNQVADILYKYVK